MRSPTYALLWEIWRRHRPELAGIIALTIAARLLQSSLLVELLGMVAFVLLFGVFNYTDSSGVRGLGRFPRRLFTLPVSSLRLVAVPMLTGVVSVELLYLLWREPLSRGGPAPSFVAVLLGALMVFYQTILWTLELLGVLRLVVVGAAAFAMVCIGVMPSAGSLAVPVAGAASMAFLLSWRHVAGMRRGGVRFPLPLERLADAVPARRRAFASPLAAQFWLEWRCSGMVLPLLAGAMIVLVIGPLSWLVRADAADTFRLLLGTLVMPVVLAVPVGMAFAKPRFWSEELSMPAFVAVRPLADEDIIAVKVKVALASAAASWLPVLAFLGIWLPFWANLDSVSRLAIQLWAFHGRSVAAVYGLAALIVTAGVFLTWRFLVSRLWSGLSGKRPLFFASVLSVVFAAIAGVAFDAGRLPGWILDDPARMAATVWIVAIAVMVKYWLAAVSWRSVSARYARQYLLPWGAGTVCLLALAVGFWNVVRIYVALDVERFRSLMILLSLLAVPLARAGLAPSCLARNRHR